MDRQYLVAGQSPLNDLLDGPRPVIHNDHIDQYGDFQS